MESLKSLKGQSLLEILFAIALFTIGVVTIGYVLFESQSSMQNNIEFSQALLLAEEGIDAVRSIRDHSFALLEDGIYMLVQDNSAWELREIEPNASKFERTITVSSVSDGVKQITSLVSWEDLHQIEKDVTLHTYVSGWRSYAGEGALLTVDVSGASLGTSTEELLNMTISNTSDTVVTITALRVQYDNFYTLHQIDIAQVPVFLVPMPSPLGLNSGAYVDIEDYEVARGSDTILLSPFVFNGSMVGTDFLITFFMGDGSTKEVRVDF